MSSSRKDFEIFLYKNKFNQKSLIDIAGSLSNKTITSILNDLVQQTEPVDNDENTIYDKIKEHYNDYKVYISTNKINLAKSTKLKEFIFFSK